ncbi:uncharacterized protein LOC111400168 [Olea europaea var. sylvestris]|uniref:uncharacterized protein LOC111400168 n=1 Tax=Olea europaea var. sylvestris TaxID=158386 RepID=UPI000C1CF700|nr:uncharacterized protein LOC111400168 [Olea europaea var. sylvestris]
MIDFDFKNDSIGQLMDYPTKTFYSPRSLQHKRNKKLKTLSLMMSMLMENSLRSTEYWHVIESGVVALAVGVAQTEAQKTEKETSKDIWDSMKKKYQGSSKVKCAQLQALRRDFATLQMKDGIYVTNYCARTMGIANKMRFHGEKMEDVAIVEKILRSLTPKFDYVACSIEEYKDIDAMSLDEHQSSLLVHEQKMNKNLATDEQPLKASTFTQFSNFRGRERGTGRGRGGRGNRDGSRQSQNFKVHDDQGKARGRGQHFDKSKKKGEKSNFVENKGVETLLMTVQVSEEPQSDVWYVDTGCSNHMCGISFGDYSTVNVMGEGDISIRTKNGFLETISNVFYVHDLSNLLSAGQLQEKGYVITIKNGACQIYDLSKGAIAIVQMSSYRLFPLKFVGVNLPLWLK